MNTPFAAAIAAAAVGAPMSNGDTPAPEGRVLLVDGDGLCYYCAGNDDTSPGEARNRVLEKIAAAGALSQVDSDMGALLVCQKLYISYYGDRWLVEILEQGILLWLRTDMGNPFNVAAPGNPLAALRTHEFWPAARAEILQRIAESMVHEEDQSERDSGSPGATPAEEWAAVRAVLPPVLQGRCGSGSLPFDGTDPGHSAPIMQQPTWQDRERGQEIRREEPPRVPAWLRSVLPKARVPAN